MARAFADRGFTPDDPHVVAGARHTGEFFPGYVPNPYLPGADGIHWIRRRG
ncbi:hypothetical protein ACFVKB_35580 [Rhodococcus sp. NPDC127530]|uniref:hypothetical protein n=1 Tax=unclassified Rhodococcus (in: high G+C Gram-positive bacteria) TaxID=192944 RepID=UPI003636ECD5